MADEKVTNQIEDQELNDLLDSALKDFSNEQKPEKDDAQKADTQEATTDKSNVDFMEDAWANDFMKDAANQFGDDLQNLLKNGIDKELGASFQKVAQTIAGVMTDEENADKDGVSTDFQSAIAKAINDLSTASENFQGEPDLSAMLGQASLEDGPNSILPFMQGMLQHLLLKEILFPPLKEVVDKYPEWLEEKKATLSANDLQRFTKQLELMRQVCAELEKEKDDDTEEVKVKRSDTIISLLQEVEKCGAFPEELVGEQVAPFQIDGESDPIISGLLRSVESPQNCCLM